MSQNIPARDLIYFDFEKTASIASQLQGGLHKEIQESHSDTGEIGTGINLQFLNLGSKLSDSKSRLVVKSIHHDLLLRVEEALKDEELSVDVNAMFEPKGDAVERLHGILTRKPYVSAEGRCRFLDFERIKTLVNGANDIVEFASMSALDSFIKTEEYRNVEQAIHELEQEIQSLKTKKERNAAKKAVDNAKACSKAMLDSVAASAEHSLLREWQISGITKFIDLILPNRKLLILQPFECYEDFKLICNLKEDCFVDSDLDNLLFAYGSQPNVQLSVFGLATHIPSLESEEETVAERGHREAQSAMQEIEHAFEAAFDGITPIESLGRFAYFPRVTIYPLAVYRTIRA